MEEANILAQNTVIYRGVSQTVWRTCLKDRTGGLVNPAEMPQKVDICRVKEAG